jgi:hypothetical protein
MAAPLDPHRRGARRIVGGGSPRGLLRVPGRSRAAHAVQRRFGRIDAEDLWPNWQKLADSVFL